VFLDINMPTEEQKRAIVVAHGLDPNSVTIDDDLQSFSYLPTNLQPTVSPQVITPKLQATGDSPLTTGVKSFAQGALPAVGGGAAAGLAAAGLGEAGLGLTATGPGALLGIPLIGLAAYLGSKGVGKLQQSVEPQSWQQNVAQSEQQNPVAARLGDIATIPLGGLNPSPTRAIEATGTLGKIIGSLGSAESSLGRTPWSKVDELSNLINVGAGAGLGAGQNVLGQLGSNQPFSIQDLLLSGGLGALFNKPNAIGQRFGFHDIQQPDISDLLQGQLTRGTPQQPQLRATGDVTPPGPIVGQFGDVYELPGTTIKPGKGKVKAPKQGKPYVGMGEAVTGKSAAESAATIEQYYKDLAEQERQLKEQLGQEQLTEDNRQEALKRLNELYDLRAQAEQSRATQEQQVNDLWQSLLQKKAALESTPKFYESKSGIGPPQVPNAPTETLRTTPTGGPVADLLEHLVSTGIERPEIIKRVRRKGQQEVNLSEETKAELDDLQARRMEAQASGEQMPKYSEESKLPTESKGLPGRLTFRSWVKMIENALANRDYAHQDALIKSYPDYSKIYRQGIAGRPLSEGEASLGQNQSPSDISTEAERQFLESNQPKAATSKWYDIINEWAKSKGITISDKGDLVDSTTGKPIAGATLSDIGGLPKEILINPNKAGADTQMHEIGHWLLGILRNSDRPRDKAFVRKFEDTVSKDPDYTRWKSERDAATLSSTPEEYIATNNGYEFLNRHLNTAKETPFKKWMNDFSSYLKTRFTKHASKEDYQRLLNYKIMYERNLSPTKIGGAITTSQQQSEESKLSSPLREELQNLIPAVQLKNGNVIKAESADDTHGDVWKKIQQFHPTVPEMLKATQGSQEGFFEPKSGQFYTRGEAHNKYKIFTSAQLSEQSKLALDDHNLRYIVGDIDRIREGLENDEISPKAAISAKGGLVDNYDWSNLPRTKDYLDNSMRPQNHLSWSVLKKMLINETASNKGIKAPPFQEQLKPKAEFNIPEGETPESLNKQIEEPALQEQVKSEPTISKPEAQFQKKSAEEVSRRLKEIQLGKTPTKLDLAQKAQSRIEKLAATDPEYKAILEHKFPKTVEFYLRDEYDNAIKQLRESKSEDESRVALARMRDLEAKHESLTASKGLNRFEYPPLNETKYSEESKLRKASGEGKIPYPFKMSELEKPAKSYMDYIRSPEAAANAKEYQSIVDDLNKDLAYKTKAIYSPEDIDSILNDPAEHEMLRKQLGDLKANEFIDRYQKLLEKEKPSTSLYNLYQDINNPESIRERRLNQESSKLKNEPNLGSRNKEIQSYKGEAGALPYSTFRPTATQLSQLERQGPSGELAARGIATYLPLKDTMFGSYYAPILRAKEANKLSDDDMNKIERIGIKEYRNDKFYRDELTPPQQKVYDVIRQQLRRKQEEQIAVGQPVIRYKGNKQVYDLPKIDEHYWPQRIAPNVADFISSHPQSEVTRNIHEDFIKHNEDMGISTEEAEKKWEALRTAYDNSEINLTRFNANRKMEGVGLPDSMMREGAMKNLFSYFNRVAADRAYHDVFEKNPELLNAIGKKTDAWGKDYGFDPNKDIGSSEPLADIMDKIHGEAFDKGEKNLKATMRVASAAMLGPLTNVHIMGSSIANSTQYAKPSELPRAMMAGLSNIGDSVKTIVETGYHKPQLSKASDILDRTNTSFERLQALANTIGNLSGRDFTNKWTKAYLQGFFEHIVPLRIDEANGGDKSAANFMKQADPNWTANKNYSESDLQKIASNMASLVHGAHDARTLPGWMMNETAIQPFFSLASWNIAQTNAWMRNVLTPATKYGNYTPLIMSLFGTALGGYIIKQAREAIADKKSPIPSLGEIINSSRGAEGNLNNLAYNLIAFQAYTGFAGALSVTAKAIEDVMHKNIPQGAAFPLDEVISNPMHRIGQAVGALINDPAANFWSIAPKLVLDIGKENVQLARIATSWLANTGHPEGEHYLKELNRKNQDLRRFEMVENMPYEWQTGAVGNPYMDMEMKKFKRTSNIREAAQELPVLIQTAFQEAKDAGNSPDVLKKQLLKLKENTYETMPSPDRVPQTFIRYLTFLNRTQGPEEASKRYTDYVTKNYINKAKSEMVPSL